MTTTCTAAWRSWRSKEPAGPRGDGEGGVAAPSGQSLPAVPPGAFHAAAGGMGAPGSARAQADKCFFSSRCVLEGSPASAGGGESWCFRSRDLWSSGCKQRRFVGSGLGEELRPGHPRPWGASPLSLGPHTPVAVFRAPAAQAQPPSRLFYFTVPEPPGTNEKPGAVALKEGVGLPGPPLWPGVESRSGGSEKGPRLPGGGAVGGGGGDTPISCRRDGFAK